jgi:hypothetical protein
MVNEMMNEMRREDEVVRDVYRATGMVAEQAGSTIDEALELLALRAETLGQGMHETARQVLDRRFGFDHGASFGGVPTASDTVTLRHGFTDQEAPQAHAQEEAQEAAEEDPLAASSAG